MKLKPRKYNTCGVYLIINEKVAKVRILMKIYSSKNGENLIKFNVAKVRILMKLKPHKYKYLVGIP